MTEMKFSNEALSYQPAAYLSCLEKIYFFNYFCFVEDSKYLTSSYIWIEKLTNWLFCLQNKVFKTLESFLQLFIDLQIYFPWILQNLSISVGEFFKILWQLKWGSRNCRCQSVSFKFLHNDDTLGSKCLTSQEIQKSFFDDVPILQTIVNAKVLSTVFHTLQF